MYEERLLSALGAGGMGEMYRARDTRLDRQVAIKILPQAFVAPNIYRFSAKLEFLQELVEYAAK